MNELEDLWAEDIAAGCAYMDADTSVKEARSAGLDVDIVCAARDVALTRMLSAARALDDALDYDAHTDVANGDK